MADKLPLPEPEEEEADAGRAADPEILAMGRILRLLSKIEEPGRARVIAYLSERFVPEKTP